MATRQDLVLTSAVAVGSLILFRLLLPKTLTSYQRASVEVGVGAAAIVLGHYLPHNYAQVAIGFGVGGVASGGLVAQTQYRRSQPPPLTFTHTVTPSGLPYASPYFGAP